ncbi:MAG: helix-turn-helix domain-containing protein [Bacteroidales bacterium]|nr:helix-turn-helix domain-containing protein [Bacteroidales bacterium]
MELKKYSNTQILQLLGLRFRDYRLIVNLSQKELAKAAGVSVSTVHKFETGTITNMNITNLMALLRPIGLLDRFDELIPEQPLNPYLAARNHQQQRVRRKNDGK